jgi:hypothetical protein
MSDETPPVSDVMAGTSPALSSPMRSKRRRIHFRLRGEEWNAGPTLARTHLLT